MYFFNERILKETNTELTEVFMQVMSKEYRYLDQGLFKLKTK